MSGVAGNRALAPANPGAARREEAVREARDRAASGKMQREQEARDREDQVRFNPRYARRISRAEDIIWRVKKEGKTLLQAWREVVPTSKCGDSKGSHEAGDLVRWYVRTFPMTIKEALHLHGGTVYRFAGILMDIAETAITPAGTSDGRTRLKAAELGLQLLGEAGRNGNPPPKSADQVVDLQTQLLLPEDEENWDAWQKNADKLNEKIRNGEDLRETQEPDFLIPTLPVEPPKEGETWI